MTPQHATTRAAEVVESLYEHRLLTAAQLHELHTPGLNPGQIRRTLAAVRRRGLADRVFTARRSTVWFATDAGAEIVRRSDPGRERPRAAMTPELARSALQAHTLAVNDVGISFVATARERGDDCGPLDWSHEVGHRIAESGRSFVVADAVLRYVLREQGRETMMYRFLELERATRSPLDLAEKLHGYVRLSSYEPPRTQGSPRRGPVWRERYPAFPPVLVVFCGQSRARLERRLATSLALCTGDPRLKAKDLAVSFALLEDLVALGPLAPVFYRPDAPHLPVDFLGRPATAYEPTGTEGDG